MQVLGVDVGVCDGCSPGEGGDQHDVRVEGAKREEGTTRGEGCHLHPQGEGWGLNHSQLLPTDGEDHHLELEGGVHCYDGGGVWGDDHLGKIDGVSGEEGGHLCPRGVELSKYRNKILTLLSTSHS